MTDDLTGDIDMLYKKNLYKFLDTNGDGSGTTNANGNYAAAATDFYIKPGPGDRFIINRLIVHIEDTNGMDVGAYGNAITLTNGIVIQMFKGSNVVTDLTSGDAIITNGDWGKFCYDISLQSWGTGNDFVQVRWTFSKSGRPIDLKGWEDEKLVITLNDSFVGLLGHYFQVQGYSA